MAALRILIVDDHDVVRHGVRALIERNPDWEVCGEAADGRDAVAKAQSLTPDVVILDVAMPELNGLEAARQIRKLVPAARVLILTMHESEQVVREVLAVGAHGYLLKSDAGRNLVAAINALSQHKPFFTSAVAQMLLDNYLQAHAPSTSEAAAGPLTPREREIVQLLAEGKTTKEVATALGLSVRTADTHRTNIMRKLDVHSVADLVRYAIRNKIIEA
jgi:DNA-binding NarL/FixJ family response regulator